MAAEDDHDDLLVRLAVRETLETYFSAVDGEDWDEVAGCFVADAISFFNYEAEALRGGEAVADWLRKALSATTGTNHALSSLRTKIDGAVVRCDSRVMASLHWGAQAAARVSVRAIRYRDELVRVDGRWLIHHRRHEPQWQYEALSSEPRLP